LKICLFFGKGMLLDVVFGHKVIIDGEWTDKGTIFNGFLTVDGFLRILIYL
jgi:hypothetical protein